MKTEEFRNWLIEHGYQPNVANTRVGNCLTVCNYEGDLDLLYAKDKCQELISRLCYSTQDERNHAPVRHKIPINGNQRTGSATLKQAVGLYIRYLSNETVTQKLRGKDIPIIFLILLILNGLHGNYQQKKTVIN